MGDAEDQQRAELLARAECLVEELARAISGSQHDPDHAEYADGDIMAAAFIVMMQAAKSAREDLQSIMDGVKAIDRDKTVWREVAAALKTNDLDRAKATVKDQLDSLSEMGETESLRLQMAMDRLSKLMSTLSNLLKKASETAQGITGNIK